MLLLEPINAYIVAFLAYIHTRTSFGIWFHVNCTFRVCCTVYIMDSWRHRCVIVTVSILLSVLVLLFPVTSVIAGSDNRLLATVLRYSLRVLSRIVNINLELLTSVPRIIDVYCCTIFLSVTVV